MNREAVVICETTYHGNTMKLAKAMARRLDCSIINFEKALNSDLSSYSIVGLGSGIYFQMHHPALIEIAHKLDKNQKIFIFSTHGSPFLGKYHKPLLNALKQNDIDVQGEFDCRGYDNTGPFIIFNGGNKGRPHEGDVLRAERFIKKLFPNDVFKENMIDKSQHVEIHDGCILCKKCIDVCPMHVFEKKNDHISVVKAEDCTHCSLCTDHCPMHVISIFHTRREAIQIAFKHKNKVGL